MSARRLRVTFTQTLLVDENLEDARSVLDAADHLTVIEAAHRYRTMAHHSSEHLDADVTIEEADSDETGWAAVLDATTARPGYLWSALTFLDKASQELIGGRYREGRCPELDALNRDLGRLKERLRLMALADDPATAELAQQEREWAAQRASA